MRDLWGVTVGLLLSLLFMAALIRIETGAHKNTVQLAVAQQAVQIEKAAAQYMTQYQTQLLAATTPTTAATITVPMLVATKFLPSSAQRTDIYGQTWRVEVLQPTSGNLQAFLITSGGKPLDNLTGVNIAQEIGADGGFYPQPSTIYPAATIMGTGGAWQEPVGHWPITQGQLAVYVDATQNSTADYLYRNAVPGDPQANTMNTPLVMAAVETSKAACSTTGAIAQDGTGALLSCQSGVWTPVGGGQWKPPVGSYGALPGTGNQSGDVRLTLDTDRAYAWNGGSWVALAVDQNGDLTVPNNGTFGGTGQFAKQIGTNGYSPTVGLPSGWAGGLQTEDVVAHGTIGAGPANSSPNAYMSSNGTIGNQGVCIDNNSGSCNGGWGVAPRYTDGWAMVTSVGGSLNAQPGVAQGSIHANDYYDRATGEWFSQMADQVSTLTRDYTSQQGQINTLNNNLNQSVTSNCSSTSYSSITQLCNDITNLDGSYASIAGIGNSEGSGTAAPQYVTTQIWGCRAWWRGRCVGGYGWITASSLQPPSVTLGPFSTNVNGRVVYYPVTVSISGTTGYSYSGGNTGSSPYYCNTSDGNLGNQILLTATPSSGSSETVTANYAHINYGTAVMYPISMSYVIPAGESATFRLSGGADGYGCGYFSYQVNKE